MRTKIKITIIQDEINLKIEKYQKFPKAKSKIKKKGPVKWAKTSFLIKAQI